MYVNYLFCINESRRKRKTDYFIYIPTENKSGFEKIYRRGSISVPKKDHLSLKLPIVKQLNKSKKLINLNETFIVTHAVRFPNLKRHRRSLIISHPYKKLDQSSEANL